jgi:hypothetical protein
MATWEERQERLGKIESLYLRGARVASIAKGLSLTERTVRSDMAKLKKVWASKLTKNPDEIVAELEENMEVRKRELWKIIVDGNITPLERERAISSLRDEDKEKLRRMQVMGIFPMQPISMQSFDVTYNVLVQKIKEVRKQKAEEYAATGQGY